MIRRYAIAIVLGAVITVGVLFTMHVLIATPKGKLDESGSRHFVDFVRVQRQEVLQTRERLPDKPVQPEAPPPQAVQPRIDAVDPAEVSVSVPAAPVEAAADLSIRSIGLVASDGDYLPIVKIAPVYPMSARNRGIEGYCLVEYTVTSAGTTKDVVVIESEPSGIFDKVSIDAALKFKYRPRVVDGEPIEVRGVRNLFRYQLES